MSSISIEVHAHAGSYLNDIKTDMQRMANLLGINVTATCNDRLFIAVPSTRENVSDIPLKFKEKTND